MKKYLALLLCVVAVVSLFGCGGGATQTPETTELGPEQVEQKDYSQWAGIVEDPAAWVEEFKNLPIANDKMSTDELRQLCVDAFKANLSFK